MKTIEMIDAKSASRLDVIGDDLASVYQEAFAGDPWFEQSRCRADDCSQQFCRASPGAACPECRAILSEAYDPNELTQNWRTIINNENGCMEVASENAWPIRATIARPTDAEELFWRKYSDVPEMQPWLRQNLPRDFVWIEDTFADRRRRPAGNLRGRGATLSRLACAYGGLPIVTRTLSPAIVYATARDVGTTEIYCGNENRASIISALQRAAIAAVVAVPDRRTMLIINEEGDN